MSSRSPPYLLTLRNDGAGSGLPRLACQHLQPVMGFGLIATPESKRLGLDIINCSGMRFLCGPTEASHASRNRLWPHDRHAPGEAASALGV